jgi:hypothetical protein
VKHDDLVQPGDTIRTGRTGRVLLKRGEETILVSPNSVIGVPAKKQEGLSTTIVQQAGSILLSKNATSSISRSRRPTSPPW